MSERSERRSSPSKVIQETVDYALHLLETKPEQCRGTLDQHFVNYYEFLLLVKDCPDAEQDPDVMKVIVFVNQYSDKFGKKMKLK